MNHQMVDQAQKKSSMPSASGVLQRKCDKCREKDKILQRSTLNSAPKVMPPTMKGVLRPLEQSFDVSNLAFVESRLRHNFSQIPVHPKLRTSIQAKLTVNTPGDIYEQEADRIANQVMSAPAHDAVISAPPLIQRFPGQSVGQMKEVTANVDQVLTNPGRPLEPLLRQDMEQRFGYDFNSVRIHYDDEAANAAYAMQARAYAFGSDIVFGSGEYMPATIEGKNLLAHELVHVVQQSGMGISQVQRKIARHPRDRCGTRCSCDTKKDPCAKLSKAEEKTRLNYYYGLASAHFPGDIAGRDLNIILEIFRSHEPPDVRVKLLRIACCQLTPEDTELLHDIFSSRRGNFGKAFSNLSTPSRCAILSILDDRIARAGKAVEGGANEVIAAQVSLAERKFPDEQEAARYAEAKAHDDELLAKRRHRTPKDMVIGALMPRAALPYYFIPYAPQIRDPVRRWPAEMATRIETAPINIFNPFGQMFQPVAWSIAAIWSFIKCLGLSIEKETIEELIIEFISRPSMVATFVPAFNYGVIEGAIEEIFSTLKEIKLIITDPSGFLKELYNFLRLMWSPGSDEIACALGMDMGEDVNKKLTSIIKMDDFHFVKELGKIAGPLILGTLIAIIAPEVIASLSAIRIGKNLLKALVRLGDKIKFLDKWRPKGRYHSAEKQPFHVIQGGKQTTPKRTGHLRDVSKDYEPPPPAVPAQQPIPEAIEEQLAATGTYGPVESSPQRSSITASGQGNIPTVARGGTGGPSKPKTPAVEQAPASPVKVAGRPLPHLSDREIITRVAERTLDTADADVMIRLRARSSTLRTKLRAFLTRELGEELRNSEFVVIGMPADKASIFQVRSVGKLFATNDPVVAEIFAQRALARTGSPGSASGVVIVVERGKIKIPREVPIGDMPNINQIILEGEVLDHISRLGDVIELPWGFFDE